MSTAPEAQTSLYETTLDNPELEELLERRERAKAAKGKANKTFKEADGATKDAIGKLDLGIDAPVRCGRFVIRFSPVPAKNVAFTTDPTTQLKISPLAVEGA